MGRKREDAPDVPVGHAHLCAEVLHVLAADEVAGVQVRRDGLADGGEEEGDEEGLEQVLLQVDLQVLVGRVREEERVGRVRERGCVYLRGAMRTGD
jgi:hypothetical protein